MQIDPFFSPYTKFKSKWINELHIKPDYVESSRRETGEVTQILGHRGKLPEQNINGLCCKSNLQQIGPHKIGKLL